MRVRSLWFGTLSLILFISLSAYGQEMSGQSEVRNLPEMKFAPIPGLPACAPGAVQSGDPSKGPSIVLAKLTAGCTIPWHWHSPNEHLMLASGVARLEMKDAKPMRLQAGGFAIMRARHIHQFRCEQACLLYVHSDAAFDIHYVDAQGKEISPAEALKVKKTKASTNE